VLEWSFRFVVYGKKLS
jgi:ribosomal protein L14E/L6E/L27E